MFTKTQKPTNPHKIILDDQKMAMQQQHIVAIPAAQSSAVIYQQPRTTYRVVKHDNSCCMCTTVIIMLSCFVLAGILFFVAVNDCTNFSFGFSSRCSSGGAYLISWGLFVTGLIMSCVACCLCCGSDTTHVPQHQNGGVVVRIIFCAKPHICTNLGCLLFSDRERAAKPTASCCSDGSHCNSTSCRCPASPAANCVRATSPGPTCPSGWRRCICTLPF